MRYETAYEILTYFGQESVSIQVDWPKVGFRPQPGNLISVYLYCLVVRGYANAFKLCTANVAVNIRCNAFGVRSNLPP